MVEKANNIALALAIVENDETKKLKQFCSGRVLDFVLPPYIELLS